MKTWEKVALVGIVVVGVAGAGVALVAPTLVREARRVAAPIGRMKTRQKALEDMDARAGWKPPQAEVLTAEQLDRFFAVRARIDEVRRKAEPQFDRLPRRHARTLEELKQIPDVLEGVSDIVGAELDAFLEGKMTPREYHWVERVVYKRWRGALRRTGTYPVALRQAAAEIETAAASSPRREYRRTRRRRIRERPAADRDTREWP